MVIESDQVPAVAGSPITTPAAPAGVDPLVQKYRDIFMANLANAKVKSDTDSEPTERETRDSPGSPGYVSISNTVIVPIIDVTDANSEALVKAFKSPDVFESESEVYSFYEEPKSYIDSIELVSGMDVDGDTSRAVYNRWRSNWGFTELGGSAGWTSMNFKNINGKICFVGVYSSDAPPVRKGVYIDVDKWLGI